MFRGGKSSPDVVQDMSTLREALSKWTDADCAFFEVGVCLGLWPPGMESFRQKKGVFWSNNPLGNVLHQVIKILVERGTLERRDEPETQFRWKVEDGDGQ